MNGTLVASTPSGYVQNTQRPLWIASGRTESTPTFYLPGRVDEVAVYASALGSARAGALRGALTVCSATTVVQHGLASALVHRGVCYTLQRVGVAR